jgi:serine/threonine protein kinase
MPAEILVTKELLTEDTIFVLQCLRENRRAGRSLHFLDLRQELANSVTLEFSDYLRFLRKFEYATLDREQHTLDLTPAGDTLAQGEGTPGLAAQLAGFFADKLALGRVEVRTEDDEDDALAQLVSQGRPPPPPEDLTPPPGPVPSATHRMGPGLAAGAFSQVLAGAPSLAGVGVDEPLYLRGEAIGQGPVGTVFRARHATLDLAVAVKEVRENTAVLRVVDARTLAERLRLEVSRQAALRHPAIVAVLDLDVGSPQPYVVTELCGGGNLRDRLKARGGAGLASEQALPAFAQLLSGLAHAHAAGHAHGNLKPENVLFDAAGNARLSDFGLARLLSATSAGEALLVDASARSYVSPEVLRPGAGVEGPGAAADVYAAGILLYEMLTGRIPGRRSPLPSAAAGVPAAVDEVFDRMTADEPAERYPDAAAALAAFHAAFPDGRFGSAGTFVLALAPAASPSTPAAASPVPTPAKAPAPVKPAEPARAPTPPRPPGSSKSAGRSGR